VPNRNGRRDRAPPDVLVDELLAMGEQFRTADGRSVAVQMGRRGDMYHAWPVFASLGGTMAGLKPDGTHESADKWKPKLVEAFQRMAELRRTAPHVFEPSLSRRDALALFLRGGTQYLITSCGGLGEVLEHGNIPVEAYPVPRAGTFPASPLVTVTTFYLPKSSKNQMVAKDLLSFYLARPNTGIELNEVRPWPPVQRNVLSRVLPKRTTLAAYNDAVHAGVLMPSHPQMRSVVWRCLTDLQLRIADGEQDVRGLAQAAADTLESLDLPGSS
jgi:arabinogalactan oligomer/maltooligosaccharide transport system substrate-binding protein